MNLLLFAADELIAPGRLQVRDRRLTHLREVLGARVDDRIRVGEIGGLTGEGRLTHIDHDVAEITFELDSPAPAKLPVTLILALPRPKMLRRILRASAEFGVESLYLINSYRVEKSYWQTPALRPESTRDYFLQGLEQSRDTMLPTLHLEPRFKPFVEDRLPALLMGRRALVAHPGDDAPLLSVPPHTPCAIAIGPEGGFIPYEVEKLRQAGCEQVSLGPRILRVENALIASLGRLLFS